VRGEFLTDADLEREKDSLEEQAAALGIAVEFEGEYGSDVQEFHLWPEHVDAYVLFGQLQTQWRQGPRGATGLDYTAVLAHMRAIGVPSSDRRRLYEEVQIMERAALQAFAELRAEHE
jgi:hypothetical protein